jgi:hypothetical protein
MQLVVAVCIFLAGVAGGIKWHAGQDARKEVERLALVQEQERENRVMETKRSANVIGAVNESRKRDAAIAAAVTGAVSERDRLRDDLEAIRANLPGLAADACRKQVTAFATVFDKCTERYIGVAKDADAHASDTLTLEQAWPK